MNNRNAKLLCLLLVVVLAMSALLVACNQPNDELAKSLTVSIKNYIASDSFAKDKAEPSTQARVPLMYSRYLNAQVYTDKEAESFKQTLSLIDSVIENGALSDKLYDKEGCPLYTKSSYEWNGEIYESKTGWQSLVDYSFSWSLVYNQYRQYLAGANKTDDSFDKYVPIIAAYLTKVDSATNYYGTAVGYDKATAILLTFANFGMVAKDKAPNSYNEQLSYYDKDEKGNFTKYVGNPNWIGFTGRPLAAGTLLRGEKKYSLKYEKSMQGLYPYDESKADANFNFKIDNMLNLDRLYEDYNKPIVSPYGSIGDSRYGILYGYLNGLNMKAYKKSVDDGKSYNVIEKWLDTLKKDADGNYVLADGVDFAVATAYVAFASKVSAPTPIGAYMSSVSKITL